MQNDWRSFSSPFTDTSPPFADSAATHIPFVLYIAGDNERRTGMNHEHTHPHWHHLTQSTGRRIFWGSILIILGIFFLLQNFNIIWIGSIGRHWPLILILAGAAKLLWPESRNGTGSGLWLFFIGVWCYVSTLHIAGLTFGTSWPILLIAVGLKAIWKASGHVPSPANGKEFGS